MKKKKLNEDTSLLKLIEHHSEFPTLYGLPKAHKPNKPMKPIISEISSAPHEIDATLSKILTLLLGKISPSHIKKTMGALNQSKKKS